VTTDDWTEAERECMACNEDEIDARHSCGMEPDAPVGHRGTPSWEVEIAKLNAEAIDLSEDLHLREERILVLSHDLEGCRADLALAQARVTALETLLERTLSAWESYQSTRGE
jgi:hypothetical protein